MSKIQWTNETWNPIAGCSKISDGCKNCYAIKDAVRLAENPNPKIAAKYAGTTKIETNEEKWRANWSGQINFASDDVLTQPIRWARPRMIFVNSMSDLFHESVNDEWIDKIFAVMSLCPQHTFQILTKRPERMRDYFTKIRGQLGALASAKCIGFWKYKISGIRPKDDYLPIDIPLPNVWLGISVENQKAADERIPLLLETPAAVRWLSCEPLLGEVDLDRIYQKENLLLFNSLEETISSNDSGQFVRPKIDWVVVGGESGNGARACSIHWLRRIVRQCKTANVPVFVKQLGSNPIWGSGNEPLIELVIKSKKGGEISEFPIDLQVREFPKV